MEDFVPFGTRAYILLFLVMFFSRAMDFVSTWLATPNMVLEGNPIAKKLGWRWGIPLNLMLCVLFAFWPLPAIVISTTSVLVAARNFQGAWLMRSMGEHQYRDWHVARLMESPLLLLIVCLVGNAALTASVGFAVLGLSDWERQPIVSAIGLGIVSYSFAVLFFSMLGLVRLRRRKSIRQVAPTEESGTPSVWTDAP